MGTPHQKTDALHEARGDTSRPPATTGRMTVHPHVEHATTKRDALKGKPTHLQAHLNDA